MLIALLIAFSNLEKRKHKNFLEKQCAGARANIEQKPYGASLSLLFIPLFFCAAATVGDSLSGHNGTLFSTWNRFPADHDCARKYGGGWWYLYIDGVCTVNSNLNGICPHSGSNCTIHWAKLNPEAKNNDPKTSEMKVRPADFS